MPAVLAAAVVALLALWWLGWLNRQRAGIMTAAALALVGLRSLFMGRPLIGALLWALAAFVAWRTRAPRLSTETASAARLLGVAPDAGIDDIRAAHRRLIAALHPDAGGNGDAAARLNAARDTLLRQHDEG
jgi:hypothetical protein